MLIDLRRGLSLDSSFIFFLPQRWLALDQQLHRRLDPGTEEATSVQEQNDAQASQLTRLLVPLVCVAIACLVAASAILLFVVLVRTRNNANSAKMDSAGTVHHIPPIAETSSRPPYEDIPLNETLTATHEASVGTPSAAGANANAGSSVRAAGFGGSIGMGLLEAIKLRTRFPAPKFAFPPSDQNSAPLQEVHRPNLLTSIHRQPSVVAPPEPAYSASSHIRHQPHPPHRDAVPLSIVSTMTNSFNNETDDDDEMLDMDLDLYLGLAAAASSSSREWIEKGASNGTTTAALSSIEEGDSSSRQLVEEIHWQGSSDVAAAVSVAPAEIAVAPTQESRPGRSALGKPRQSQQHFVDALYSLVAAGVPPQAILGASYDSADSDQARSRRRIEVEGTPAAPEVRRKYARTGTKKAAAATADVVVNPCRVPRKHGGTRSAADRAAVEEEEGRDDAEGSHAGSSADGRNDTLLEL
jgi:hypothetical protein